MFIDTLDLPDAIKAAAKEVYSDLKIDIVPRGDNRKKIVCYCVHQAYLELGVKPLEGAKIAEKVSIDKNAGIAAIGCKMEYREGRRPASATQDPIRLMRAYSTDLLYLESKVVDDMESMFRYIMAIDKHLLLERARVLVVAFILCYLDKNGYGVDRKRFLADVSLERTPISNAYKQIEIAMASRYMTA